MVVGDEDQSIYGFRHADIRNILDFERDFPDAEVVKLEQNYRSTQTILSAANAVVERNRERRPKRLWTDIAGGEPVRLSELGDEHEEARWVAGEIERLGDEEGVRRSDVAVFYRTNAMSRVLEDTLVRFELPYQVIGGTKFYERAEIKDAVAYLSLLVNPSDQVSFARVVNRRAGGSATRARAGLAAHANTTGPSDLGGRRAGRGRARDGCCARSGRSPAFTRWSRTCAPGLGVGPRGRDARGDPARDRLPGGAGGRAHDRGGGAGREPRGADRGRRPSSTLNREQEGDGGVAPLEEFLQQISLYTEQDGLQDGEEGGADHPDDPPQREGPRVRHGLHRRLRGGLLPTLRALEEGGEEEERRLCYVGITRARAPPLHDWARERRLFGRAERNLPSRFVDELPAELTERQSSAPGAAASWDAVAGAAPARRESTPARRWSCRPVTTSSTPASARAS